jgi:hypothetical protein
MLFKKWLTHGRSRQGKAAELWRPGHGLHFFGFVEGFYIELSSLFGHAEIGVI